MEKSSNERVLVVESEDALRRSIVSVLSDGGYEVSTDCGEGMKSVLAFRPDVVILGANPPPVGLLIFCPKSRADLGLCGYSPGETRRLFLLQPCIPSCA